MELNEKLLEAHKKVVQQKLNSEVARTIFEGGKNLLTHQDISDSENDTEDRNAMEDLVSKKSHANDGKRNSSKFAPKLEEIKEESRNSSKQLQEEVRVGDKDRNRASDMLRRRGAEESETHFSSETSTLEPRSLKIINPQGDKTNYYNHMNKSQFQANFNPQSLDSGIATRSTSSHSPDNHSEDHEFGSQDLDTDNDIVDTENNETEDSDSEDNLDLVTDDDSEINSKRGTFQFGIKNNPENQNNRHHLKFMDERNSDILSDIYSTAFSKVPKVLPSDSESIYSLTSTLDRDFDYDSLDQKLMNNMRDIYRNPHLLRKSSKQRVEKEDSSVYEEINMNKEEDIKPPEVSEVYINNDYDTNTLESMNISEEDSTDTQENLVYSSGEKMMIAISGDSESVYSNKLRIEVNNEQSLRQNNEKRLYSYMPAGTGRVNQQRRWNNFGSADSLEVIDQEAEAHNNGKQASEQLCLVETINISDADDDPMINYKHQIAKPKISPTITQLNSNQSDHFMKPVSHVPTRATGMVKNFTFTHNDLTFQASNHPACLITRPNHCNL